MPTISNPVLPGFNPDPSFLRVGDDYYLATSTFEWLPGVPVYHSRDLVNWRLLTHILTEERLANLTGVADSAGVWAPSLSYADGQFWLVYSVMRTCGGGRAFKDGPNYLITAPSLEGPWSDPIFLTGSGFDASLFHDDDGRKWIVNLQWDYRKGKPRFGGIRLQEYNPEQKRMVGESQIILRKDCLIEGPNLYRKDGYYYLMLAEGGTGWNHGISMARSRNIEGPYELDPQDAVLTARDIPEYVLCKAGHGELVQTQDGEWYLAHLASRHFSQPWRCTLGRETYIQKVVWNEDGWLRLWDGSFRPKLETPAPELPPHSWPEEPARDDFDGDKLGLQWSWLRSPLDESWADLKARPGFLRLRGRESTFSLFEQSLVAKRLQSFRATAETCLEFKPTNFTQSAGLICYYDTGNHIYLRVTHDEERGTVLGITLTDEGKYDELLESQIEVNNWPRYYLRAEIDRATVQFYASSDGQEWRKIGDEQDFSKLSDEYAAALQFTGTLVGICAQDINDARATADFDYFELKHYPVD
jgi:xylan 1,4-beta-xylosidase